MNTNHTLFDGIYITLSTESFCLASGIGVERYNESRGKNLIHTRGFAVDSQNKTYTDCYGALGEAAAAAALGIDDFVPTINNYSHPDKPDIFYLNNSGKTKKIDVKTTDRETPYYFYVPEKHSYSETYFVYMQFCPDTLKFRPLGWIKGSKVQTYPLWNGNNRIDERTGTPAYCYRIPVKDLKPFEVQIEVNTKPAPIKKDDDWIF